MNAEEAESSATVPVAAGGVARERRNILTTSARRTRCGRGRPVPVPEGRRRKLAGGKAAPADAAPGNRAAWLRAPTGHRRKWPEATRGGGNVAGRTPPKTSSMPRRGMDHLAAQPGAAPATRACPRLISCGVPPGRRAKRWRHLFGRRLAARAAAKFSRRARILQSCSTEKAKVSLADIGSLIGDFPEQMSPLVFSVFIVSLWFPLTSQLSKNA